MNTILYAVAVFCIATAAFFSAAAQEPEQELFNQLYKEIISASDGKISAGDTSFGSAASAVSDRQTEKPGTDAAALRLQHEIDKMVNEIKVRHDDAVKFMQDR